MSDSTAREKGGRWAREDVLSAAEDIVDRDGWGGLSMNALARDLGVKAPSLYHHVAGLDAVRAEIQARTLEALVHLQAERAAGLSGTDGLRAMADAHREFALAFPHRYLGLTQGIVDREHLRLRGWEDLDVIIGVVRSTGIPEDLLGSAMEALFAAHHGAIALEIGQFFAYADPDAVFDSVVDGSLRTIVAAAEQSTPTEDET